MIMQKKNTSSLWRNRDFLLLWSGQTVSMIGGGVSELAFPLLILALTHSPAQAGLVGALRTLPYFIFTLPGGVLVDRWNRKRVMIICDTARALSLFTIPLALAVGRLTLLQISLVALIEGTLFVFFDLANTASMPQVVAKEQLSAAVAQNQATFGLTSFISPPLGTLLYSISRPLPFLVDAISYIVSVISLFFIRTPFQQERTVVTRNAYKEIVEGLRWLWHQPLLRTMALLNCGLAGLSWGLPLLVIVNFATVSRLGHHNRYPLRADGYWSSAGFAPGINCTKAAQLWIGGQRAVLVVSIHYRSLYPDAECSYNRHYTISVGHHRFYL